MTIPINNSKSLLSIFMLIILVCQGTLAPAQNKPLNLNDLKTLITGRVYSSRIASLVEQDGISFSPTPQDLDSLKVAGADDYLLRQISNARYIKIQRVKVHFTVHQRHPRQLINPAILPHSPQEGTLVVRPSGGQQPSDESSAKPPSTPPVKVDISQPGTAEPSIVGAHITIQNWRNYASYMPVGMQMLFSGNYAWKVPKDFEIDVDKATPSTLPRWYSDATKAYSKDVRVVHLPDGHNDIENYKGGVPFPNPEEPDKGYKLLADLWFAYSPYLMVGTTRNPLRICSETHRGYSSCTELSYVFRQTLFNRDPGAAIGRSERTKYWYTEWASVEEPEQLKYATFLILYPKDSLEQKDSFVYLPSLRRWIRSSLAAHCSPVTGTDYLQDDFKRIGFNGGLGSFDATFVGHQGILTLIDDFEALGGDFPANYYAPIGLPKPSWGKWQLRDVDVIDVRPVRAERGYCYKKRIVYEDSVSHYALWEDGYDSNFRFWKSTFAAQRWSDDPEVGRVPAGFVSTTWDFKYNHLTNTTSESKNGRDVLINGDAPPEFHDFRSYSMPEGLAEIMR